MSPFFRLLFVLFLISVAIIPEKGAFGQGRQEQEPKIISGAAEAGVTESEDSAAGDSGKSDSPDIGWGIPTAGGVQLYSDELYFRSWRIQKNVWLNQYRLLDKKSCQYAQGSFEKCKQKLEQIRQVQSLGPMSGRAVVLLHGLAANHLTMKKLAVSLEQTGHYNEIVNASYPTTRLSIEEHAAWLGRLVGSLEGIEKIDFVGHSLGGIVIRAWLSGLGDPNGKKPDLARVGRVVMIGTPNQGSFTAEYHYTNTFLARTLMGETLKELGVGWKQFSQKLETPPCPFAILAGSLGPGKGMCAGTLGENDWVVTVDSVRLPGADDFRVLPYSHVELPVAKESAEMVDSFFMNGYFTTLEQQSPLRK